MQIRKRTTHSSDMADLDPPKGSCTIAISVIASPSLGLVDAAAIECVYHGLFNKNTTALLLDHTYHRLLVY